MICKKDLFQLPEDIHYLNGAYMSPLPRSVEEAGISGMQRKRNPICITTADYFTETGLAKSLFAKLINATGDECAIIPSASYGLGNAIKNIPVSQGRELLLVEQEFPSDFYPAQQYCVEHQKELKTILAPEPGDRRSAIWSEKILDSITADTAAVIMSSIHWTDGTLFDLKAIGEKCRQHNCLFIVDGTQSVGALPIDVQDLKIDALVCAGYKWLLAPYSIGIAYYGPAFLKGIPMENSWLNRSSADGSRPITDYTPEFRPGAARYDVGESCNYTLVPMLVKGLELVTEWEPAQIQDYSRQLAEPLIPFLREKGFYVADAAARTSHLFGMRLPEGMNRQELIALLQHDKIFVSPRGAGIRISIHVYNTESDIHAFMNCLDAVK